MLKKYSIGLLFAATCLGGFQSFDAHAQQATPSRPALIVTNDPIPLDLKGQIYTRPVQLRTIRPEDISGANYYTPTETLVSRKINELSSEMNGLQANIADLSSRLNAVQRDNEQDAATYFAAVATINTQLQAGTTPSNPRLVERLSTAEANLGQLEQSVPVMNDLALQASNTISKTTFLEQQAEDAFRLPGAVEEDHVRLAELEDRLRSTLVVLERIHDNINDDIARTSNYLGSERNNLRTLSLAVSRGDLYGVNFSSANFVSNANQALLQEASTGNQSRTAGPRPSVSPGELRPLVKIRFDRSDVDYEQPVYSAVNDALQRYPNAQFKLVGVTPQTGNAAEVAIESTRARRNTERVLRTLGQMGVPANRIDVAYEDSNEALTNEVHLFIK